MISYTFLKSPCRGKFNYAKIFAKFSKTKFVFQENSKRAISGQKLCNLFTFVHGFRYIFSWVRVKYVIQAVCLRTKAVGIKALL